MSRGWEGQKIEEACQGQEIREGKGCLPQFQDACCQGVGWWEGDLYRGLIIKVLEEGEILVKFVDLGNLATLGRGDMVRKASKE